MNIVMVSYMDLTGPGVMHMYHFANELQRRGHRVLVLLNGDLATVELMEQPPRFELTRVQFSETDLDPSLVHKIKAFKPDLVHIWTPRNVPARVGLSVKYHTGAKLLIHYEDDEDYLYDFHEGNVLGDLAFFVNTLRDPNTWNWHHPVVSFLANHFADAFTAICRPYVERLERQWGKKAFLLYPGVDLNRFHPIADGGLRIADCGFLFRHPPSAIRHPLPAEVVLYSGSIGAFHQFDLMLQAFAQVARCRPDAVLVHLGHNHIKPALDAQVRHLGLEGRIHFLGAIPHREIHRYLALADVLVQSGRPNTFNEFRLPAKLPEYLAMGKPVITFAAGIGRELEDGVDVLKTVTGEPDELAEKIELVLDDPTLAEKLGRGARRRAEELFDWHRNTDQLIAAYEQVLAGQMQPLAEPRIRPSVATEVFGSWWETRGSRQILVVASTADDGASGRVQSLTSALAARGHHVSLAVPEDANPPAAGTDQGTIHAWSPDSLNWLIWQVDPEILLFDHWSAMTTLDTLMRRPVILDLAGGWSEPSRPPGDVLRALAKADFFLCESEEQRQNFLTWAGYFGLTIPRADIAPISFCRGEASGKGAPDTERNRRGEASGRGAPDTETNLSSRLPRPYDPTDIEPLDRFCRAPFARKPPPLVATRPNKTFGMLIDEAIMHYRRGGISTLFKETLGFVSRKLRGA